MSAENSLPYGIRRPVGQELNSLQASAAIFNRRDENIRRQNAEEARRAAASLNDPVRILSRPQSPDYPPPDPNDRATTPPRAPYPNRLAVATPVATSVLETPVPPAVDKPVKINAEQGGSRRSVKLRKRKSKKRNMSKMKKRKNKTNKRK